MRTALALIAATLTAAPSAPASVLISDDPVISPQAIVQVVCIEPKYITSGTAFRVGNGVYLSVNHVTSQKNCFIGTKPLSLWYAAPHADFSMLHGDDGPFLKIDCYGFVKGRKYIALGFARGESPISQVELTATGTFDDGEAILTGMVPVIPGMSGGPVLDEETGKVVGVINAENFEDGLSWSVELKNEPVCKGVA